MMKRFYSLILLMFVSCFGSASMAQKDDIIFKEDFEKPLHYSWQWIREDKSAYKFTDDGLKIKIQPGGLMGKAKDAKNILVRSIPEETRTVSVWVDAQHKSQFEQAGLILYYDDDTYIKLVLEHVDGKTWVVMVTEIQTEIKAIDKIEARSIPLVLKFHGDLDADSDQWIITGSAIMKEKEQKVSQVLFPDTEDSRIGIFTQSGQPNADRWVTFRDFTLKKE